MDKIICASCGASDFKDLGNGYKKCEYCGTQYYDKNYAKKETTRVYGSTKPLSSASYFGPFTTGSAVVYSETTSRLFFSASGTYPYQPAPPVGRINSPKRSLADRIKEKIFA